MWGNLNNFVDKAREMGEKALEEVKKKAAEMEQQMDEAGRVYYHICIYIYVCMYVLGITLLSFIDLSIICFLISS